MLLIGAPPHLDGRIGALADRGPSNRSADAKGWQSPWPLPPTSTPANQCRWSLEESGLGNRYETGQQARPIRLGRRRSAVYWPLRVLDTAL